MFTLSGMKILDVDFVRVDMAKTMNEILGDHAQRDGFYTILIQDKASGNFVISKKYGNLWRALRKIQLGKAGRALERMYPPKDLVDNVNVFWGEHPAAEGGVLPLTTTYDIGLALLGNWLDKVSEKRQVARLIERVEFSCLLKPNVSKVYPESNLLSE